MKTPNWWRPSPPCTRRTPPEPGPGAGAGAPPRSPSGACRGHAAPQAQQGGEAVTDQKTAIQFQLITTKDGRPFFPAFTDWTELRKFCGPKQQQTLLLRFDDYVAMLQRNDKAHGFVINPMGLSLTLDRGTVMSLFKKKQEVLQRAQAKAAQGPAFTEETVEKDTQVMVGDPVQVPDGLLEAVCQLAAQREDIRTLWLRQMVRQDGVQSLIIVVDHTGDQAQVFQAIAGAASAHCGQLPVDMIPYGTGFAAAATEDAQPFYSKG
ncbi:MAG: enhanced serine sensitivity protein SseB [Lawsonibacter sp.]